MENLMTMIISVMVITIITLLVLNRYHKRKYLKLLYSRNVRYDTALEKCMTDKKYFDLLTDMVMTSPINTEDAIDYLDRPVINIPTVKRFHCMGYQKDYIIKHYNRLLRKHL